MTLTWRTETQDGSTIVHVYGKWRVRHAIGLRTWVIRYGKAPAGQMPSLALAKAWVEEAARGQATPVVVHTQEEPPLECEPLCKGQSVRLNKAGHMACPRMKNNTGVVVGRSRTLARSVLVVFDGNLSKTPIHEDYLERTPQHA